MTKLEKLIKKYKKNKSVTKTLNELTPLDFKQTHVNVEETVLIFKEIFDGAIWVSKEKYVIPIIYMDVEYLCNLHQFLIKSICYNLYDSKEFTYKYNTIDNIEEELRKYDIYEEHPYILNFIYDQYN